ncbi:ATP-dependent nuclease [Butyrivibrio sp. WCD3002]|uniref:ATP-dependent nuclease n=1 Tax=Butyrivibrio sp. WCD3002 TaxID=1280676 RepID=UPI000408A6E2|nr:AAA family ATPase [Butyrivibrio sp. WCD3002]
MYISEVKEISNYRNLSGKTIKFNDRVSFLIGENNIGKTNILELINTIFAVGKFSEDDFTNILEPIRIIFTVRYEDDAIGFFEDYFDVEDNNSITIIAEQENVDGRIEYYHATPNHTRISGALIKKINILYYYAQRMPSKELDFRKTTGSGKVLNYFVQKSLENSGINELEVLNQEELSTVIEMLNGQINGLNTVTGDKINAYLDPSMDKVISRILMLGDENGREIGSLGEGIQYAFNILLQIIEIIHNVKISRRDEEFQERLITIEDKKFFPLILLLDEPEIHQHPYRQRNMIKKIDSLMNNKNAVFVSLLSDLFQIDGLIGQVFVATHSPNILLSDYHQFVRIYRTENEELSISSGMDITLEGKLYKHMLRNFVALKEAMFSRCVVFVEGDTENGAIPVFAQRKEFDLDEHGVGIVKLDGADSVKPCMELYRRFGIKCLAIIDRDKFESYDGMENIFFTTEMDYESDVYAKFEFIDYLKCCKELEMMNPFIGILQRKGVSFDVPSFIENPTVIDISTSVGQEIMVENKESQLDKLKGSKNASKGAILAEYVTSIPDVFSDVIDMLNTESV